MSDVKYPEITVQLVGQDGKLLIYWDFVYEP